MPSSSSLTLIHPTPPPPPMDWFSWLSQTNLEPTLIYDYGVTFARNQLQLEDASFFNHEFLQSMGVSIAKHRLEILKLAHSDDYSPHRRPDHHHHRHPKKLSGVIKSYLRKYLKKLVPFRDEVPCSNHKDMPTCDPEPNNWYYQEKWRGAMERKHGSDEFQKENKNNNFKPAMNRTRSTALSGPLNGRMTSEKLVNTKVLRLSGPLDGKRHERLLSPNRSPLVSGKPIMGPVRSPRSSGPLDPRLLMMECKSPRLSRPSDANRPDSPLSFSPYLNKTNGGDFDFDFDDHKLWPTLFRDLKPT
ncbi:hypothetical protein QN277_026364 [Acacia crassicarpa]|uniref:SAM domain-containing protein n=1 Tax=Acacia crassicarpa TaxID=499986 RepID=A0AAE1K6I1_9FABA|nr:hypothetical protein QN277_026364 [Acacia crassicarpa]